MATKYELPEEVNEERLRILGKEVEMKTFKRQVNNVEETKDEDCLVKILCKGVMIGGHKDCTTLGTEVEMKTFKTKEVPEHCPERPFKIIFASEEESSHRLRSQLVKIICVGDYPDRVETIGVFIRDYLQVSVPTGKKRFFFKTLKCQRDDTAKPFLIKLHLQILEKAENLNEDSIYSQFRIGALVFWESRNPSSVDGAEKWRQNIREFRQSVPCVLVTDNTVQKQWVRPAGKTFENEAILDQFCKDHGFVDHFEIKSRDWESGEKSVFGQAVNCLIDEIFSVG